MKLTPEQLKALKSIAAWNKDRGPYSKHAATGTIHATREPQLEALRKLGLIVSKEPFGGMFHSVKLSEAGETTLKDTTHAE